MEPAESSVLLRLETPVAVLQMNDPRSRNALSPRMIADLRECLDRVEQEPQIRAVILTGSGTAFCAGAHLRSLLAIVDRGIEENRKDTSRLADLFHRIYLFRKPMIAAVNGPAFAGGCGLAGVCDLTVASLEARFSYSEVRIGFVPAIVAVFLLRQVGEKKARDLLLTGRVFEPAEALQMGLIHEVVPPEDLMRRARELALQVSANAPEAMRLTKELIPRVSGVSLELALDQAVNLNALARTTEDFREGITAFLERRKPEWK